MSITYESTVNSHHDRLSTITIKNIREDGEDIHVTNCLQLYFISPVEMDEDSVHLNSEAKYNIEVSCQQVVPKGAYEICYSFKPIENKPFLISATDTIELHFLSRLGLPPVNNLDDYNYTIFFTNFIYGNTITLTASYLLCNTPIKPEVNYYGKGPISLKPLPVGCMQDEFLKPGSYNIRAPTLIDSHSAIRWHPIFKPNEFIIKTSDSPRIIEISYKELSS